MTKLLASLALITTMSCTTSNQVAFNSKFAAQADYDDAYRNWTRKAELFVYPAQVADISATFKSPNWWGAYGKRKQKVELYSDARVATMLQSQKQAYNEYYEFQVLLTTYQRRENDLAKGDRSVWRLVLADDQGNEVLPLSIKRDRRSRDIIRAEFPDMGDFARAYVVRFPRKFAILDGKDKFTLTLSSSHGAIRLAWINKR